MLAIAVSVALLVGRLGIVLLLGTASCIAWSELTRMFGARIADRPESAQPNIPGGIHHFPRVHHKNM